jgi:hypothetical protein
MKKFAATTVEAVPPVAAARTGSATRPTDSVAAGLGVASMSVLALAAWLLLHPYAGITHDSTLYTLFALRRLHPDNLGNDIFLRFGSQDSYTLFTPLYAWLIQSFELDRTAATLTLLSQGALVSCAWLLARQFASRLEATLGVALLLLIPAAYGAGNHIFEYFEGFLTPRLPAEALTVGALVAVLQRRHLVAAACLLTAVLLHPLMGIVGVVMIFVTFIAPVRPKAATLLILTGVSAGLVVAEATTWLARADAAWLTAVRGTSYFLFVTWWSVSDWSRTLVPLGVLAAGALAATRPLLRQVCAGALGMVALGLLVNLIFSDGLHLLLFMGAQTWRWLWLANVMAVTLAPPILMDCWSRGRGGQTGVLLLIGALLFRGAEPVFGLVPLALACVAARPGWGTQGVWRLLYYGAWAVLTLALVLGLSDRFSYIPIPETTVPALPQQIESVCADGVLPGLLVLSAWLALRRRPTSAALSTTIIALGACACIGLSIFPWGAWALWTRMGFTQTMQDKFATWRAQIPPRSEVFWSDSAIRIWSLLDRPSWWSPQQMAGGVFSREKALVMQQRAQLLAKAARNSNLAVKNSLALGSSTHSHETEVKALGRLNLDGLRTLCSDPQLGFVVTWQSLTPTRYPPVVIDPSKVHGQLYLYACADLRS